MRQKLGELSQSVEDLEYQVKGFPVETVGSLPEQNTPFSISAAVIHP